MEIGGYDTIIQHNSPQELARLIMEFINWPDSIIEYDIPPYEEDFFWYKNKAIQEAWDEDGAVPVLENTMIYFLMGDKELTIVTDKANTDSIRQKFCIDNQPNS